MIPKQLIIAPSALYQGEVVLRDVADGAHWRTMKQVAAHKLAKKHNLVLIPERFHRQNFPS